MRKLLPLILAALAVLFCSCSVSDGDDAEFRRVVQESPALYEGVIGSFETVQALVESSDLIVIGTVSSRVANHALPLSYIGNEDANGHYVTEYEFTVTSAVHGDIAADSIISLAMPYGADAHGIAMRFHADFPLLKVGGEYLLFLAEDTDEIDGAYTLFTPHATWFELDGDSVTAPAQFAQPLQNAGRTLPQLLEAINGSRPE